MGISKVTSVCLAGDLSSQASCDLAEDVVSAHVSPPLPLSQEVWLLMSNAGERNSLPVTGHTSLICSLSWAAYLDMGNKK